MTQMTAYLITCTGQRVPIAMQTINLHHFNGALAVAGCRRALSPKHRRLAWHILGWLRDRHGSLAQARSALSSPQVVVREGGAA